jgi:hypothetical protein
MSEGFSFSEALDLLKVGLFEKVRDFVPWYRRREA